MRDSLGNWVKGFSGSIGHATSMIAQFSALRDGLILASQLGIQNIEIELDAKTIVDLLHYTLANRSFFPLLNGCRSLLSRFHQVKVEYALWEANKCVDALARRGCSLQEDFVVFNFPPSTDITSYVNSDADGLYYCRLSAATLAAMVGQFLMQIPFNQKGKRKKKKKNLQFCTFAKIFSHRKFSVYLRIASFPFVVSSFPTCFHQVSDVV